MRVIFLDIDGVLNSAHWYKTRPSEPTMGRRDDHVAVAISIIEKSYLGSETF
jgi:hypothetical protein